MYCLPSTLFRQPVRPPPVKLQKMPTYRGRFAPSPTGPLHFGSLVAAMASYADARANHGAWLVRMEDVDVPRTVPGAAVEIFRTLEAYGFGWDRQVVYQSEREELYAAALHRLERARHVYPCGCSRKDVSPEGVYPGTCRNGLNGREARAWRLRVEGAVDFCDIVQGERSEDLAQQAGDFVLRRADGLWAYQLAVVVDDAEQGITHVVRGADLLSSTARQIYLQRLLGLPQPVYLHVPVAVGANGDKLSKQTGAMAIDLLEPITALRAAASFLGHPTPHSVVVVSEFWDWLIENWRRERIPPLDQMRVPEPKY
jgi:glutamyl-Q tRNA(Asp) synthetase